MSKIISAPKVIVGFVVLVVAFAAVPYMISSVGNMVDTIGKRAITVLVEFEPNPRTGGPIRPNSNLLDVVSIRVDIGVQPSVYVERATASPWTRTVYAEKNDRVTVGAEQFTGTKLSCTISENGAVVSHYEKTGPSEVLCFAKSARGK